MLTHAHQRRFRDAGYTARYIEAEDPQLVDDEIQIFRGAFNTGVTIQIGLSGLFYVNEFIDGLMTAYGEYRTMSHAIDRALEICEAQTLSGTLKRLGFTHVPQKRDIHQGRRILDADGNEVFSGTADETWKWLRSTGRIP